MREVIQKFYMYNKRGRQIGRELEKSDRRGSQQVPKRGTFWLNELRHQRMGLAG